MDTAVKKTPQYQPADGYTTLIVKPEDVQLGDITDHHTGLLRITEITRRMQTWTVGGQAPDDWRHPAKDTDPPRLSRHVPGWCRIRIHRKQKEGQRLPGHTKTVTSHNPRLVGCYTRVDGWKASCSCGWESGTVHTSKGQAQKSLIPHHAQVVTDQTLENVRNLARVHELEDQVGARLPWAWRNGIAEADLGFLPENEAQNRLGRWAVAMGTQIRTRHQDGELYVFSPLEDSAAHGIGVRARLQGHVDPASPFDRE